MADRLKQARVVRVDLRQLQIRREEAEMADRLKQAQEVRVDQRQLQIKRDRSYAGTLVICVPSEFHSVPRRVLLHLYLKLERICIFQMVHYFIILGPEIAEFTLKQCQQKLSRLLYIKICIKQITGKKRNGERDNQ